MDYFIADTHFGHRNALIYDKRPFSNIEENDNTIIKNWNSTVSRNDNIYILGDLSFYNLEKTISIIESLNGKKHLIYGNHDTKLIKNEEFLNLFEEVCGYKELYINKEISIVLCHYPIPCFNKHYHNWYHFYGHVHITSEDKFMNEVKDKIIFKNNWPCNMLNIGCMKEYMNYTPRTFEELIPYI